MQKSKFPSIFKIFKDFFKSTTCHTDLFFVSMTRANNFVCQDLEFCLKFNGNAILRTKIHKFCQIQSLCPSTRKALQNALK